MVGIIDKGPHIYLSESTDLEFIRNKSISRNCRSWFERTVNIQR